MYVFVFVYFLAKFFLDEEGDKIVLDNLESYKEALKVVETSGGLLQIVVEANLKSDIFRSNENQVMEFDHLGDLRKWEIFDTYT